MVAFVVVGGMGDDQCGEANVRRLLADVSRNDPKVRDSTAAQLSKVAAKAEGERRRLSWNHLC